MRSGRSKLRTRRVGALAAAALGGAFAAAMSAQSVAVGPAGTLVEFDSVTGPAPVGGVTVPLAAGTAGLPAEFRFEFGFATAEVPAANTLLDSLSIALSGARAEELLAALVTVDAFGLTVAPATPGGFAVTSGLRFEPVAPRVGFGPLGAGVAYAGTWTLPPEFRGEALSVNLDFFHNANGQASAAYAFVVPEPAPWLLLGAGLATLVVAAVGRRR
jgi:hypothetical protein